MEEEMAKILQKATESKKETKKFLDRIRRKPPKNLDNNVHNIHDEVFAETDCLECANCCRTTSPIFTTRDIERISKFLRIKSQQFENLYLRVDEDRDYVLKKSPCAFLYEDNTCMIYSVRPKACREYPHTDRKKFHQITGLTFRNTMICPASYRIVQKLREMVEN